MSTENATNPFVRIDLEALANAIDLLQDRVAGAPQYGDSTALGELAEEDWHTLGRALQTVRRLSRWERYPSVHGADRSYFLAVDDGEDE